MISITVYDGLNGSATTKVGERSRRDRTKAMKIFAQLIERFPTAIIQLESESHGRHVYFRGQILGKFFEIKKPEVPCDIF